VWSKYSAEPNRLMVGQVTRFRKSQALPTRHVIGASWRIRHRMTTGKIAGPLHRTDQQVLILAIVDNELPNLAGVSISAAASDFEGLFTNFGSQMTYAISRI
jgi:hypothetical protein